MDYFVSECVNGAVGSCLKENLCLVKYSERIVPPLYIMEIAPGSMRKTWFGCVHTGSSGVLASSLPLNWKPGSVCEEPASVRVDDDSGLRTIELTTVATSLLYVFSDDGANRNVEVLRRGRGRLSLRRGVRSELLGQLQNTGLWSSGRVCGTHPENGAGIRRAEPVLVKKGLRVWIWSRPLAIHWNLDTIFLREEIWICHTRRYKQTLKRVRDICVNALDRKTATGRDGSGKRESEEEALM